MLQKNTVVKARAAIESLYAGVCDIIEHQEYIRENKSTGHRDVVVLEGQPCRLSFSNSPYTGTTDGASELMQITKLFISPDISVKAGSKINVTQNGVATDYKSSGEPAVYQTHQEIMLELFRGWA